MDKNSKTKRLLSLTNILIFLGLFFIFLSFGPLIKDEIWFYIMELRSQKYSLEEGKVIKSPFGRLLTSTPIRIEPINKDFSIVIERIGVNAPIVKDVSVANEQAYREALKSGIAHALVSDYPSKEAGNVYLFAHASLNFFELGKYSTVFNLLRKLSYGDRVNIFYETDRYIYEVAHKEVVKGWDLRPLNRPTIEPLLTLQTCDPPGTTLNRFVVTAKLIEVEEN